MSLVSDFLLRTLLIVALIATQSNDALAASYAPQAILKPLSIIQACTGRLKSLAGWLGKSSSRTLSRPLNEQVDDFVMALPMMKRPVNISNPKKREAILIDYEVTLNRWKEFVTQISQVNYNDNPSPWINLQTPNGTERVRLQPQWISGWRKMGLIDRSGRFRLDIRPREILENFNRHSRSSGFFSRIKPGHRETAADSSHTFALMITNGFIPFDDPHALFFHMADLLDPYRRRAFVLAEQFLLLEGEVKGEDVDVLMDTNHNSVSYRLILGIFEGNSPGAERYLGGFLSFMSPDLEIKTLRIPVSFQSRLDFIKQAIPKGTLEDIVIQKGLTPFYPDDSHLYLLALAIEEISAKWKREGRKSPHFDMIIKSAQRLRNDLAKNLKLAID